MKQPTLAPREVIDLLHDINETSDREKVAALRNSINDILKEENRCDSVFALSLALSGILADQLDDAHQRTILHAFFLLTQQTLHLWEMSQDGNHRRTA
jgi:hypothetical protein